METLGKDETGARMSRRTAYLSLQNQLFGEQHGLVAEGLGHLHPSGRIPGTAWTFDTWPKTRRLQELKVGATADQNSKMSWVVLTVFGLMSQ